MQVLFVNTGFGTNEGHWDVEIQSLKVDSYDRPYAIVSNPFSFCDSCRAEFNGTEWVVDLD